MHAERTARITDARIELALEQAGIDADVVSWWGDEAKSVTIRIETHIGNYAEGWLYPNFTVDDVVAVLQSMQRRMSESRDA